MVKTTQKEDERAIYGTLPRHPLGVTHLVTSIAANYLEMNTVVIGWWNPQQTFLPKESYIYINNSGKDTYANGS